MVDINEKILRKWCPWELGPVSLMVPICVSSPHGYCGRLLFLCFEGVLM